MSETFEDAKEQVHAWKPNEIRKAGIALVTAGIRALSLGDDYFGPDNIPDDVSFETPAVMGIATRMLKSATVITRSYVHQPELGIFHGERKSLHTQAHGRPLKLYSLVSRGIAEAWLERNDVEVKARQDEWAFGYSPPVPA